MNTLPLESKHLNAGAKMVNFHGWQMPLQYEGIIAEHKHTREKVSVFDVSHMGEFIIKGQDADDFLNYINPKDVTKLQINQAAYSCLLNEQSCIIDDLIIYKINNNDYMLCVNASNTQKDFDWIKSQSTDFNVELKNISEHIVLLAYQGKYAQELLASTINCDISEIKYYHFQEFTYKNQRSFIARMGYTGEDGFEVFLSKDVAADFWQEIFDGDKKHLLKPAGLGARDTLRLEMCFPLHGNDIDEQHSVLESKLAWILDLDKDNFIGKDAIIKQKESGIKQKLTSFLIKQKGGIPRKGFVIKDESAKTIGVVTSGSMSPMLGYGIGMGYVSATHAKMGSKIYIEIRKKMYESEIVKPPFIKYSRK